MILCPHWLSLGGREGNSKNPKQLLRAGIGEWWQKSAKTGIKKGFLMWKPLSIWYTRRVPCAPNFLRNFKGLLFRGDSVWRENRSSGLVRGLVNSSDNHSILIAEDRNCAIIIRIVFVQIVVYQTHAGGDLLDLDDPPFEP